MNVNFLNNTRDVIKKIKEQLTALKKPKSVFKSNIFKSP